MIDPNNINKACRHPERYTQPDPKGMEAEVMDLLWGLTRALQPDYVLEAGTYTARTTLKIAEALHKNGHGHLDTLEWDERLVAKADIKLHGHPVRCHRVDAFEWVPRHAYDLVLLDVDDKTRMGNLALRLYGFGAIHQDTTIVVHDTGSAWPTRETLRPLNMSCVDLPTPLGVSICQFEPSSLREE